MLLYTERSENDSFMITTTVGRFLWNWATAALCAVPESEGAPVPRRFAYWDTRSFSTVLASDSL